MIAHGLVNEQTVLHLCEKKTLGLSAPEIQTLKVRIQGRFQRAKKQESPRFSLGKKEKKGPEL